MSAFWTNFVDWEVIQRYSPELWLGFRVTLELAVLVAISGLFLGLILALIRSFQFKPINLLIILVVDVCRAVPPLVQLVVVYFAFPHIGIQLSGFVTAWVVLTFILASFAEEIFWAGITSVHKGQWEAARSTGLAHTESLVWVVLPQAIRMTIPPLTNRTIAITKHTALASVVSVQELLAQAMTAQAYAANPSPLTAAVAGYLIIIFPLVAMSRWVETRFKWKY